jgi:hypothetical protein
MHISDTRRAAGEMPIIKDIWRGARFDLATAHARYGIKNDLLS